MQTFVSSQQIKQPILAAACVWAALSVAIPSHIANYNFKHFDADEGLTISISRSAPPLAIIEDARLSIVRSEPAFEPAADRNHVLISAGTRRAWPRLAKYAKQFKLQLRAGARTHRYAYFNGHAPFSNDVSNKKLSHMQGLLSLVQLVPNKANDTTARIPSTYYLAKNDKAVTRQETPITDLRSRVEAPLTTPSVPRGIPTGEDLPAVIIPQDHVSAQSATTAQQIPLRIYEPLATINGGAIPSSHAAVAALMPKAAVASAAAPAPAPAPAPVVSRAPAIVATAPVKAPTVTTLASTQIQKQQMVQPQMKALAASHSSSMARAMAMAKAMPRVDLSIDRDLLALTTSQASMVRAQLTQKQSGQHLAQASTASKTSTASAQGSPTQDLYKIMGQVELSGGLAVTGNSTKLTIQWKTGSQIRDAVIDYSTGRFLIAVPTLAGGKVFGTLVDDTKHVLGRGEFDLDGVAQPDQKILTDVALTIDAQQSLIKGRIISAYSVDNFVMPMKAAEVFGPSQIRDLTDKNGYYRFSGLSADSTFVMEAYATDYWGSRVVSSGDYKVNVPLFSGKMVQSFLDLVGQSTGAADYGIVWGEIRHRGKTVANAKVELVGNDAIGPIYLNELRIPDKNLKATSSNGIFAFVKVKPGLQVVRAQYQNHELPSSVVAVSASMVSYADIRFKTLTLKGVVSDAIAEKNVPAQMSIIGTNASGRADQSGFNIKIPSSDPVVFVEANAGADYYVSRAAITRSEATDLNVPVYEKGWVAKQLKVAGVKASDNSGIMVGVVKGPGFKVSVDDYSDPKLASEADEAHVVYFNAKGVADPELIDGAPGGGAFMIPNLRPGMHTLTVTSADGEITTTRLFVAEAGVLNVTLVPLRP